jgi:putative nucleotidyltransferase with HDIG domain
VSKQTLLVIADEKAQLALPEIIAGLSVRIVDWKNVEEQSSVRGAVVLVDVDLHDISKVRIIKDNLPKRVGNQCRIIAVDSGCHLSEVQANALGASDLLSRPLDIHALKAHLQRHFTQEESEHAIHARTDQQALEKEPGGASVASAGVALDRVFAALSCGGSLELASIKETGDQVVEAIGEVGFSQWLSTVRSYHEGTFQHCLIVTGILAAFGNKYGMRKSDVQTLTVAGLLHDVGKAQIPIEILDKPGKLTNEEFAIIKRHSNMAYGYLCTQNNISPEILDAVRQHHEYLDGSGYPDGLQAQQIGDLTRIVTVCDVYGALIERRAYKAPFSPERALDILTGMARDGKIEYDLVRALGRCV